MGRQNRCLRHDDLSYFSLVFSFIRRSKGDEMVEAIEKFFLDEKRLYHLHSGVAHYGDIEPDGKAFTSTIDL